MARQVGVVTYELVAKACDELAKAGIAPSQRLVIDKVGGSFGTVGPHIRAWKSTRDAAAKAAGSASTPRNIEVDIAVSSVVRRAVEELREELQTDIEDQVREIAQLTTELDQARTRASELVEANAALKSEVDQLGGQVSVLARELDAAKFDRNQSAAALDELRGQHGRVVEAKESLERRRDELQQEATRLQETARTQSELASAAQVAQARAEREMATAKEGLEARLGVEQRARSDAEQRVLTLLAALDGNQTKLERLAAAEAAEKVLRDEVDSLRRQLASVTGMLQAAAPRAAELPAASTSPKGDAG